jgi:hypothetical protein
MNDLNPRFEGFAREQLAKGHGEWWIAHELVRMGHVDLETARAIVKRAESAVETPHRSRELLLLGLVLILLPASLAVLAVTNSRFFTLSELVTGFMSPPISFPMIVGIALIAHARRRRRNGAHPVRTGLWWRADPFESP